MIKVKRIQEGLPTTAVVINSSNFIDCCMKDDSTSWFKYWDGNKARSCVIEGTPEELFDAQ